MDKVLAFDLSSGESGIETAAQAAVKFLDENPDWKIKGFSLEKPEAKHDRLGIIICSDLITSEDGMLEVRRKTESTLAKAIQSVIDGETQAVLSAAPSGALVTAGFLMSRPIEGIKPAFSTTLPATDGTKRVILDVGANIDVNAESLLQFALMGSAYSKVANYSTNPVVRLLNIGTEDKKGTKLQVEAFKLLKESNDINFKGNLEPNGVFTEEGNDVIVTDAFSGNIMLKSYEGAMDFAKRSIKSAMKESILDKVGIALSGKFRKKMKTLSTDNGGGAIVLGLNHIVFKVHGEARELWYYNSLNELKILVENDLISKIKEIV